MIRDAFGGTGTLEGGVFKPYADQAEADQATVAAKPEAKAAGSASGQTPTSDPTALPDDFPSRALLLESGFDSLEKVKAGMVKPDGAEKSPVEDINGIGKKTLEAIEAALK